MRIWMAWLLLLMGGWSRAETLPDVIVIVTGRAEDVFENREELGDRGMELRRFYSGPAEAVAFASLLTGRIHYRSGVAGDIGREYVMHDHEVTAGEVFRGAGYDTAFFGVWKNGSNWPHCAEAQGFDQVWPANTDMVRRFFAGEHEAPRFAIVSAEDEGKFLRDWLKDGWPGLMFCFAERGTGSGHCYGGPQSVHEGGVRSPCFVAWDEKIETRSVFDRLASNMDVLPTLVALCGIRPKEAIEWDGMSLAPPLLNGGEPGRGPNRMLFSSFTPPGFDLSKAAVSMRTDRWLAIRDLPSCRNRQQAESHNGWELYDLVADPFEDHDVSNEYKFVLSEMKADFSFWMDRTTRFGLRTLPIEVGHPEWPVVSLPARDLGSGNDWPIQIIRPGRYRIAVEKGDEVSIQIGQEVYSLADGEGVDVWLPSELEKISILSREALENRVLLIESISD